MIKIISKYIFWSVLLTLLEFVIILKGVPGIDFTIIFIVNLTLLYLFENLTARFLYGNYRNWDMGGGFLPETKICDCDECKKWRKDNAIKIIRNRVILSALIILFVGLYFQDGQSPMAFQQVEKGKIKRIENKIQQKLDSQFDSLKRIGILPSYVDPEFKIETKIEKDKKVVTANYSYLTTNEEYSTEIYDYCSGCYLYSQSLVASQMLKGVQRSVNTFLEHNLENGEEIQITLSGYSDGAQINRFIPYKGEFGNFPIQSDENFLTSYILNDNPVPANIKTNDALNNSNLAFLRAFSVKEFIDNYIPLLRKVPKKYAFYAYTENDRNIIGSKYRKVKLSIGIINPSNIVTPPEISSVKIKLFNIIAMIISILIIPFLGKILEYHYKAWHDAQRKKEPYKRDMVIFFVLLLVAIILIGAILYYASSIVQTIKVF